MEYQYEAFSAIMAAALKGLNVQSIFNLSGKNAVVSGGGTGLGLITARALAANGANVYITGRRAEKLKDAELRDSASGGSITGIQMDVTDKDSIKKGVAKIAQKHNFVNLLVSTSTLTTCNEWDGIDYSTLRM